MKKSTILKLSAFLFVCSAGSLTAQTLTPQLSNTSYNPISNGTSLSSGGFYDDEKFNVPIGFNLVLEGNTYTQFYASSNGFIWFGNDISGAETIYNPMTSTSLNASFMISVFATDVHNNFETNTDSDWLYETRGTAPNRVFVMEWRGINFYNNLADPATEDFDAQILLYEGSNDIEILYGTNFKTNSVNDEVVIGIRSNTQILNLNVPGGTYANPNWSSAATTTAGVTSAAYPSDVAYRFTTGNISLPEEDAPQVAFYPNPLNGTELTFENIQDVNHLYIYDVTGRLVHTLDVDTNVDVSQFNLGDLPNGTYIIMTDVTNAQPQQFLIQR